MSKNLPNMLENTIAQIRQMVDVNSVVGEPITLPDGVSMNEFVRRAIEKKVAVVPGTAFNCDTEAGSQSFRLNYSTPSDDDIRKGIRALGELAAEMLSES